MIKQHEITSMRKGSCALRHYNYYANGISLKSKSSVLEAIELKINNILRKEKMNGQIEKFDYKKMDFVVVD